MVVRSVLDRPLSSYNIQWCERKFPELSVFKAEGFRVGHIRVRFLLCYFLAVCPLADH